MKIVMKKIRQLKDDAFIKIFDTIINSKKPKYKDLYEILTDRIFQSERGYEKIIEKIIRSDAHFEKIVTHSFKSDKGFSMLTQIFEENSNIGTTNESAREAWLKKTLKKIPDGLKILDAGAGELKYKKFCRHLDYVSQDFAQYDGQGDQTGLQMKKWDNSKLDIVSDIIDIPVKNESFDAVMCIEVFEHLPEPAKSVREFSRIIKKNGTLIITAPFCSLTHFAPYYFANGYSRYWYKKILSENGFKIKEIKPNGNYFEYLAQETRRIPEMAKKYSSDKLEREEQLGSKIILGMLNRLSQKDKGSDTLLCFGYQVVATKV